MRTWKSWAKRKYRKEESQRFYAVVRIPEGKPEREIYARVTSNIYHSSDDGGEDPPVLIPNTEVKLTCAEGTLRATARKIRSLLLFIKTCLYGKSFSYFKRHFAILAGEKKEAEALQRKTSKEKPPMREYKRLPSANKNQGRIQKRVNQGNTLPVIKASIA